MVMSPLAMFCTTTHTLVQSWWLSGLYEKLCIPCIFILTYASMPWARPQRPQVRVGPKNAALPCLALLRPILCSRSNTRHTMYVMSRIGSFLYTVTYIGPMCVCPYIGTILYGQTHIGPILYCLACMLSCLAYIDHMLYVMTGIGPTMYDVAYIGPMLYSQVHFGPILYWLAYVGLMLYDAQYIGPM